MTQLVGRCQTKCPKKELDFRIKNNLLHPLECEKPFDKIAPRSRKPINDRICKQYGRPAANQQIQIDDVRVLSALKETVDYLVELEQEFNADSQWTLLYEYIADRYRSIRQDIIVQGLKDELTSRMFEQMICFYVKARCRSERLKTPTYNATLHNRELDECLERWTHFEYKSEEMRVLHLLYSIQSPDIFGLLRSQRKSIDKETYSMLWNLFSAHAINNYIRVFRIISKFNDSLRSSILVPTIRQIRLNAIEAIWLSNKCPVCSIPIDVFCKWLAFQDEQTLKKCVNECFEKSPIIEQSLKFHGCKLKSQESISFSVEWVLLDNRSQK